MSAPRRLPPLRILVAIAATVLALVVLGVNALLGGDDAGDSGGGAEPAPVETSTTSTTAPPQVVDTSVVLAPDWYPKGSSRYSDRSPTGTITTLPPTTAPDADEPDDEGEGDIGAAG